MTAGIRPVIYLSPDEDLKKEEIANGLCVDSEEIDEITSPGLKASAG